MAEHLICSANDALFADQYAKPRMLWGVACWPDPTPNCRFILGDAEDLPFSNEEFSAVVMNAGILHLAQPDKAIAEAYRLLCSKGRFAFVVWATPDEAQGFAVVLQAVNEAGNSAVVIPSGHPFFRFSHSEETRDALQVVGFHDIRCKKGSLL